MIYKMKTAWPRLSKNSAAVFKANKSNTTVYCDKYDQVVMLSFNIV